MIGSGPWWSAGQTFTSWVPLKNTQPPQYQEVLVSDGKIVRLRTLKRITKGMVWVGETGNTDEYSVYSHWADRPSVPPPP